MSKTTISEKIGKMTGKDWLLVILGVIIIILIIISLIYRHKYYDERGQVVIVNDSISYYKNKYNEEYIAKNTYVLENKYLQQYNDELYAEYKALKDNPLVITKTVVVTKLDTVKTKVDSLINDSNMIAWGWSAEDSTFYRISGKSEVDLEKLDVNTVINELEINASVTLDLIDDGKQMKVIAKSDNPYMCLENVDAVVIDPDKCPTLQRYYKPKRWGFGPYVGVGFGGGVGVGFNGG